MAGGYLWTVLVRNLGNAVLRGEIETDSELPGRIVLRQSVPEALKLLLFTGQWHLVKIKEQELL